MARIINTGAIIAAILCTVTLAKGENISIENELQAFSIKTGATRIIYPVGSNGASMTVMNTQSYPMLVQSEVIGNDRKSKAPLIGTPPLFSLDGPQLSRKKVVATSDYVFEITK